MVDMLRGAIDCGHQGHARIAHVQSQPQPRPQAQPQAQAQSQLHSHCPEAVAKDEIWGSVTCGHLCVTSDLSYGFLDPQFSDCVLRLLCTRTSLR